MYPIFLLVMVSFDPTSYTVTEGIDGTAELMLVRIGNLNREVVVSVTTTSGSAIGMTELGIYAYRICRSISRSSSTIFVCSRRGARLIYRMCCIHRYAGQSTPRGVSANRWLVNVQATRQLSSSKYRNS